MNGLFQKVALSKNLMREGGIKIWDFFWIRVAKKFVGGPFGVSSIEKLQKERKGITIFAENFLFLKTTESFWKLLALTISRVPNIRQTIEGRIKKKLSRNFRVPEKKC